MQRVVLLAFLAVGLVVADFARTQNAEPIADFTFKRVKVPGPGAGKRILVQITPGAPVVAPAGAAMTPDLAPTPPSGATVPDYGWFWREVSPSLASTAPGRLEAAVLQLANEPSGNGVAAPRLDVMLDIITQYGNDILRATVGTQVSPALVLAVIGVESGGRPEVISDRGAAGLMQLVPATAQRFGVGDILNASDNITGGVAYLDWLMTNFDRDPVLVLAAYNAGETAVRRHEGVPPFDETRAYVPRVLAAWVVARALCLTPPELATDGCVFAVREARNDG
ncbi:MAG: lytic transglycosylase domain-containing protein [Paracoccaceae bacterium]